MIKIAQNDVELATFWLFRRNCYEIIALCNQVLSILVNLPRSRR